jgi:hypothetical protein
MKRARRLIGPIAAVWLVSQAATLSLAPVMLDATPAACTCSNGADATCPMHHGAAAGFKTCVMQSTTTSATVTLNSLFSVAGLVPASLSAMAPLPMVSPVFLEYSTASPRPLPPDPPPPRA